MQVILRLLICNIGNRDILLPIELLPAELHKSSHRDKINYIRSNKTKIGSSLQITMIKKGLEGTNTIFWANG